MKSLYPLQILAGMILVLLSPVLEQLLRTFHVKEGGGGLLYFALFTGSTLGTLSISWLARRFRSRTILQVAACGCAAGLALCSLSSHLAEAALALFATGTMCGIIISFPGALFTDQYRDGSGAPLNFLYAYFAVGVTLYPVAAGFILSLGVGWQRLFQGLVLLFLAWAGAATLASLPDMKETEGLRWSTFQEARREVPRLLVGSVVLNVLYVGAEVSLIGWVVYYLQKVFPGEVTVFRASRVLTYFWIGMVVGRVLTGVMVKRFGSFPLLISLVTGAFLAWAGALASPRLFPAEVLFSATGIFFSGIFPIIASYSSRFSTRNTSLVFSLIFAGGGLGGAVFPLIVGVVAQWRGVQAGLTFALPTLLVMLCLLLWLRRKGTPV